MAEQKKETIDFVYAIDCTGSMSSYINKVQEDIYKVIQHMETNFPEFKLRLGCVAYRDWCDKGKRLETKSFSENVGSFKSFVGTLEADGGGDTPEDVLGGLDQASKLGWSSNLRVLFHICDAPPHNTIYHDLGDSRDDYPNGHPSDPSHQTVLNNLKNKNIHLCIAKLNNSVAKMIRVFKQYADKIESTVEERSISDATELLEAVKKTLTLFTKFRREVKQVQSSMVTINNKLSTLQTNSRALIAQTTTKIREISNDIDTTKTKIDSVEVEMNNTKREFDNLKRTHSVLLTYARNANTEQKIEKAEEDCLKLSTDLTKIDTKYAKAQDELAKTQDALAKSLIDVKKTEESIAATTTKKEDVKKTITSLSDKLKGMTRSTEKKKLQGEIRGQFKILRELFKNDAEMKDKIRHTKSEIIKLLGNINERTSEIENLRKEAMSKLDALDTALDALDERS